MEENYKHMLRDTDHPYCWCCGRDCSTLPIWWLAPFLIERAHIVNKPRSKDRRAVVLLCSICHRVQHGAIIREAEHKKPFPAISLENMLWMKWKFDREYLDLGFLRTCSIRELPAKAIVHRRYREAFKVNQPHSKLHVHSSMWQTVLRDNS